ncbi:MAG: hypothetical protein GXO64_00920 [Candidatus Micrarchaeota archaeon]|nr:hypothetical protein [Candidatus Micrarchaeota archaeon]
MKMQHGDRKIAKDEVISFVLKEVMKEKVVVESQSELVFLVNRRLSKADNAYSVSAQRLRMIAVKTPYIRVTVETREGKQPEKCPVCLHALKKRKMKNLRGKRIVYGYICLRCGFKAEGTSTLPRKYVFTYLHAEKRKSHK